MPELSIWKNQYINRLKKDMDDMFDRIWGDFGLQVRLRDIKSVPRIDVTETPGKLMILAEIPGASPDDFDILVDDTILTITGEICQDFFSDDTNTYRKERRYGTFSRTLQLPCRIHVNEVKASYKNGVLKIVMPKCKRETPRRIKVEIR